MKTIDIVVPCYNEEEVLPYFVKETNEVIATIPDYRFRYIFVDDGSKDKTLSVLKTLASRFSNVKYISFSRNFGKESAMYAGLKNCTADYVIVMDADLQHPPKMFPQMIEGIEEGNDCCALYRAKQTGESKIRQLVSKVFFSFQNNISDVKMPEGAVDYRIMSRKMVNAILELSEVQRFSKGIFCWVGFKTKWIEYQNVERTVGTTKWSLWGLFKYALDGITAFSVTPLRVIAGMGFVISLLAFIYIIITLVQTLIFGIDVEGYVTTLCSVLFLGGIIELSVGILGEYIGRIYNETKHRPIYIAAETNLDEEEDEFD
ncbi:MAG: glycosyltransferase family 2 protein [Ruminococcus sp.]|nr:glycosyltransferase family 2 protein [Ruminococcus sp.]MBQ2972528.1 glycosyltransferase family 2 protein [Ruminococcus sp.]MBQ7133149.1 glycosyltransferase family 2 protein [Ruminococcus sp.]